MAVANLVTNLIAKTSAFERGMIRSRRQLSQFQRQADKTQRAVSMMSKAFVAVGGAYGAYRLAKSFVRAAAIQQQAEMRLAAAIGGTEAIRQKALKTMKVFASEMQRQTVFGDEQILAQMAYAKNLGIQTDKLKEATRAAVGLAAKYGIDLKTSMMLVGRANAGQTSALTRYGIVIDSTIPKLEQFNQLLKIGNEAFRLAQEEAKTPFGRYESLANTLGDYKETAAKAALQEMNKGAANMQSWLDKNRKGYERLVKGEVEGLSFLIESLGHMTYGKGIKGLWAVTYGRYAEDFEKSLGKTEEQREKADNVNKVSEAYKKAAADVEKINKRLQEQTAIFGMTQRQADFWRMQQRAIGLSGEELEKFNRLLARTKAFMEKLDALERAKLKRERKSMQMQEQVERKQAEYDALLSKTQSTVSNLMTPRERIYHRFYQEIQTIQNAFKQGILDKNVYAEYRKRLYKSATEALIKANREVERVKKAVERSKANNLAPMKYNVSSRRGGAMPSGYNVNSQNPPWRTGLNYNRLNMGIDVPTPSVTVPGMDRVSEERKQTEVLERIERILKTQGAIN